MKSVTIGAILLAGLAVCSQAQAQVVPAAEVAGNGRGAMEAYAAKLKADWARRAALGEVPAVITEPSIKSGKILTPTIDVTNAPGVAAVELTLEAGTVGVASFQISLTSPSGNHTVFGGFYLPPYPVEAATETVKFQVPSSNFGFGGVGGFGLYAQPGAWTITSLQLMSKDGNSTNYSGSELTALFPDIVLNVANSGTPDGTPPTFGKGKILTPSVSVGGSSPYFAARMAVADDLSGVANVSVVALAPGSSFPEVFAGATISLPIRQGHVVPYAMLPANAATGTYTIDSFSVCDVAGNCAGGSGAAAVKAEFGATTFQVTP